MSMPDRLEDHNRDEAELTGIARTVTLTEADYAALTSTVRPELVRQTPWDSVFSVGAKGEIFPYVRSGYTPEPERNYVRGTLGVLDNIADQAVAERGENGRFFVNRYGVFYKDRESHLTQCLRFDIQRSPRS